MASAKMCASRVFDVLLANPQTFMTAQEIADYINSKYVIKYDVGQVSRGISHIRRHTTTFGYTIPKVKPGPPVGRFYTLVAEDGIATAEEQDLLNVGHLSAMRSVRTAVEIAQRQAELVSFKGDTKTVRRAAKQQVAFFSAIQIQIESFVSDLQDA